MHCLRALSGFFFLIKITVTMANIAVRIIIGIDSKKTPYMVQFSEYAP